VITWQEVSTDTVELSGELSQHNVESLMPVAQRINGYDGTLHIELSQLSHVDSAGLAFLIELQQQAVSQCLNIAFSGSTSALEKLIALYGAESLLKN